MAPFSPFCTACQKNHRGLCRPAVLKALTSAGFHIASERRLPDGYGDQYNLATGQQVNIYDTGSVVVQGKRPYEPVKQALGIAPAWKADELAAQPYATSTATRTALLQIDDAHSSVGQSGEITEFTANDLDDDFPDPEEPEEIEECSEDGMICCPHCGGWLIARAEFALRQLTRAVAELRRCEEWLPLSAPRDWPI